MLTLVWGINWPIMKLGVTGYPPLTFRTLCMWLGLPVLASVLMALKVPFRIERRHWPELLRLAVFNMFFWHALAIVAIQSLSSGRAAILGYTMPIFAAVIGALWFGDRLAARAWTGVAAAALGVALLLWHEMSQLAGKPLGVLMMLTAESTKAHERNGPSGKRPQKRSATAATAASTKMPALSMMRRCCRRGSFQASVTSVYGIGAITTKAIPIVCTRQPSAVAANAWPSSCNIFTTIRAAPEDIAPSQLM